MFNNVLMKCFNEYDFSKMKAYTPNSFIMVETEAQLREMAKQLEGCPIVGVDLENEHHDTYNGFTCLIQLSSYNLESGEIKTYVIDVLTAEISK